MSNINRTDMRSALERSGLPMLKVAVVQAPDDKSITQKPKPGKTEQTMFFSDKLCDLLSQQAGNEVFAAYAYYGAVAWFHKKGLEGFAKHMESQGSGEIDHARKIFKHMSDANAPLVLPPIAAPFMQYESVEELCKAVLDHEKSVTKSWRDIGSQAIRDKDAATMSLSQFFLLEQIEEEDLASTMYDKVRAATPDGILTIDAQLLKG